MTPEVLAQCTGARIDRARTHAPFIVAAMDEFDIDSPQRQAAFLSQIGFESGSLRWPLELWGPTDQQLRYEPPSDLATRLGNTEKGDGLRYRGRGWIMITGRFNYGRAGAALGIDFTSFPQMAEEPAAAARIAGWYWSTHKLNFFADAGDYVSITKGINGGTNGLAGRQRLWAFAKTALGVTT